MTDYVPGRAVLFGAAAVSGVLTVLAYAPIHIAPLAFVALIPVILAVESRLANNDRPCSSQRWTSPFFVGWLMGLVANVGGFYWFVGLVTRFGGMPMPVGVLAFVALAAQQALVGGIAVWGAVSLRRQLSFPVVFAWPIAWVAAEALVPMTFPWKLGYTQYLHPLFIQTAELGGPLLVSFLVAMPSALIATLVLRARGDGLRAVVAPSTIIATAILVAALVFGAFRLQQMDSVTAGAETLSVGVVEADISIEDKWDPGQYARILELHQQMSVELVEEGADLIVWSESSYNTSFYPTTSEPVRDRELAAEIVQWQREIPFDVAWVPAAPEGWDAQADSDGFRRDYRRHTPQAGFRKPLLVGVTLLRRLTQAQADEFPPNSRGNSRRLLSYNSSLLLAEDGEVLGRAHKVVRMPLSEYMPGAQWVWDTFNLNLYEIVPMSGLFGAGPGPQLLTLPEAEIPLADDVNIGILNCYEDLSTGFVRGFSREDNRADVLINQTNDGWFGHIAPIQHFALAAFRAVEIRTTLLRATNTGVSAMVDPAGRVQARTSTYDAESLLLDVPLVSARRTLFAQIGNWPGWLAMLAVLGAFVRGRLRARAERRDVRA